jgi:dimethylglycine dehydrogenase
VIVAPGDAQAVWDALLGAGAVPFGLTAIDLARTEVGLIIIAVDYEPGERSPWDLSMDRFIDTDAECVGAAALRERGENPPKRFKTLQIEGEAAPDYGAVVTKDGREVGVVTSPASSPRVGTIGLAVLDADVATDGEKVEVAVGDGSAAATVAPLSILDPQKRRPRD